MERRPQPLSAGQTFKLLSLIRKNLHHSYNWGIVRDTTVRKQFPNVRGGDIDTDLPGTWIYINLSGPHLSPYPIGNHITLPYEGGRAYVLYRIN